MLGCVFTAYFCYLCFYYLLRHMQDILLMKYKKKPQKREQYEKVSFFR
ncbi:protein of unknown function [Xenorhabdus doucetiae]|uniref:Uncharacterized protein n=1 Tax=Xenorhabdus doucetiae TaxID=351671 RepID=A0A068QUD3_9GAMM|nr:protein of unknown function [Xenorhabdus doucetiae]